MRPIYLRTAATLAILLPALMANASAQERRGQGGAAPAARPAAPAPAPHISAPAPQPHISAPAPAPHVAAPAPHIAAPAPRIAPPAQHFAAPAPRPTPHITAPTPHVAAPAHIAAPRAPAPQIGRRNVERPNVAHQNVAPPARRIESATAPTRRGTAPTSSPASTKLANPNTARPGKTAPNTAATKLERNAAPPTANPNVAAPGRANQTVGKAPPTPSNAAPGKPNVAAPAKTPATAAPAVGQGPGERGRTGANQSQLAREQARSQIYAANRKPVLQNQSFVELARRDPAARQLARATFRGRLAESFGFRDRVRDSDRDRFEERRRFRGIVLGWVGPVFWPYAYSDFVDYTFYPYATDTFWPYAYDDVYDSMFAGYAPDWSAYASVPARGGGRSEVTRRLATAGLPTAGAPEVCSAQASGLTDWPIEQIAQQVAPDDNQRVLLDQLRDAAAKAVSLLQGSCPIDLPSTPTGRLAEMRQRIQTMLQVVQLVRPALERFYQSLSDEQKERFNALDVANSSAGRATRSNPRQPDLTQVCSGRAAQTTSLPADRIAQTLRLDDTQRAALEQVKTASAQAADILSQNCPQDQSLTPTGRLAAMEQRLDAMLQAIDTVQPSLTKFYTSLSDEQKARFNRLPRRA
jgi:ABC-type transporter MlaC component